MGLKIKPFKFKIPVRKKEKAVSPIKTALGAAFSLIILGKVSDLL